MKKETTLIYLVILTALGVTIACAMPGLTQKQPSIETVESPLLEKTEELIVDRVATTEIGVEPTEPVVDTIIATEVEVEPTEPVVASTDAEIRPTSLPNAGQISYIHDGKLWVYRVDSGKTLPIFTFLDGQEYGSQYPRTLLTRWSLPGI